jgi:hypothetical protein
MAIKTLADLRPAERRQLGTAVHEAAHAAIGVLSGAVIDRAEVVRGGPRTNPDGVSGYCSYDRTFASDLRQADITAAGTAGEALWHHGQRPSSVQLSALLEQNAHDRDKLAALARPHRERPLDALTAAMPLVLRCWGPIARLASQLHFDGEINHAAVLAALGIPNAEDAHHHAAMIRSGATPGSFRIDAPVRF